jgi:thermitase
VDIDAVAAAAVSHTLRTALDRAYAANKLMLVAAGNDNDRINNEDVFFTQALFVGSTDIQDLKSSFSNFGPGTDISAPGTSIWTTVPDNPLTTTVERVTPRSWGS